VPCEVVTTAIAAASYRLLLFPQTIPHNPQRNAANFPVAHPFFLLAVIALVKQVRFISNLVIHVVAACNGDVGFKDRRSETVFSGRRLRSQGCARRKPFVKPIKTVKCAARPVLGLRFRFCAGCLQHCVAVGCGAGRRAGASAGHRESICMHSGIVTETDPLDGGHCCNLSGWNVAC
jgi:hypothetical protein